MPTATLSERKETLVRRGSVWDVWGSTLLALFGALVITGCDAIYGLLVFQEKREPEVWPELAWLAEPRKWVWLAWGIVLIKLVAGLIRWHRVRQETKEATG
jgi:hypothetical protein